MAAPRWSTLGEAVSHDLNQPIHNDRAGVLACLPVAPDFDQSNRSSNIVLYSNHFTWQICDKACAHELCLPGDPKPV